MMYVTEAQVRAVPTPAPVGIWHPIGHGRLMDRVDAALDRRGIEVESKRLSLLGKRREKVFGTYDVRGFHVTDIPGTLKFQIGFRGSIDKSLAEALAFGTVIMVCSNGIISGERINRRKNTTNILQDLDAMIEEGLDDFTLFREVQELQYRKLIDTPLNDKEAHDVICRAAMRKDEPVVGRDIPNILEEWHNPSHDEFSEPNAWRLHNAFTEVAKYITHRNPLTAAQRGQAVNRFFTDEFAADLPTIDDLRLLQTTTNN